MDKELKADIAKNGLKLPIWLHEGKIVARRYMKIAKEMPELLDSNHVTLRVLPSISQAIHLLSATEEVKTDVIEKIESGEKVTIAEINRMKKEMAEIVIKPVLKWAVMLSAFKSGMVSVVWLSLPHLLICSAET